MQDRFSHFELGLTKSRFASRN